MTMEDNRLSSDTKKYTPTPLDIQEYISKQQKLLLKDPAVGISFNQYLKQKYFSTYSGELKIEISKKSLVKDKKITEESLGKDQKMTDFSGSDFTGCTFKNIIFKEYNLSNSVFCDVNFENVYFEDSILSKADFRGADLANCRFSEKYKHYSQLGKGGDIQGMKFSTTDSLARKYANIKNEWLLQKEHKELITKAERVLNEAYKNLSLQQTVWYKLGRKTGNLEYDRLDEKLKLMTEKKIFPHTGVMDKSFQNIFSSENNIFEPAYMRGSTKKERDKKIICVPLEVEDVKEYLKLRKEKLDADPNSIFSLNDFAKNKEIEKSKKEGKSIEELEDPQVRVVADCSSKIDNITNQWAYRKDFSGLDFVNADLSGAIFSGSIFSNCNFKDTHIEGTNFESAEMVGAVFANVKARGANFFNSDLKKVKIHHGSDFNQAFLAYSNGAEISIKGSRFDNANIKNAKWPHAKIANSLFNSAYLLGVSLPSASFEETEMCYAVLDKAILTESHIVKSNWSGASANLASAQKMKIEGGNLKNIEAKQIDLSESTLDRFTQLNSANLKGAILKGITAKGVNCFQANLNQVDAENASLVKANLNSVNIQFANLKGASLEGVQAHKSDLSYSILENANASNAKFVDSVMRGIKAEGANFTQVNLNGADLRNCNFSKANLTNIMLEKAKLEGGNLENADLTGAMIFDSIIDKDFNIRNASIGEVQGHFLRYKEKAEIGLLYEEQQKTLKSEKDNGNPEDWLYRVAEGVSWLPSTAQIAPELYDLYNNLQKLSEINYKLASDESLIEEQQKLIAERMEISSNLIKNLGVVLSMYAPISEDETQPNALRDTVINYILPVLIKGLLSPAPPISPTKPSRVHPSILEGVDEDFVKKVTSITINLLGVVLKEGSETVREIAEEILVPEVKPTQNIIENRSKIGRNLVKLLTDQEVKKIGQNSIMQLLTTFSAQANITKIAENYFDNSIARFASRQLFSDTVGLFVSTSVGAVDHIEEIFKIYESVIEQKKLSSKISATANLTDEEKGEIKKQRSIINLSILENVEKIVSSLLEKSQIVDKEKESGGINRRHAAKGLTRYLTRNKDDFLEFFNNPEVQKNISLRETNPKLVYDGVKAAVPFLVDTIPIIVDLSENCLKDKERLAVIIEQFQDIMDFPSTPPLSKITAFTESINQFQRHNPVIKDILTSRFPNLLIKHANELGPVVERFLSEDELGKKLRLKGEKLLKSVGIHAEEMIAVIKLYKEKKYPEMAFKMLNIISDPQVLGLVVGGVFNWISYHIEQHWMPDFIRKLLISEPMAEIINSISNDSSMVIVNGRRNLAEMFKREAEQRKKTNNETIYYSLIARDLKGLDFEKKEMKLNDLVVEGFSFKDVEFKNVEFKNSVFCNTNFTGVKFTEYVELEDVTMDSFTYSTIQKSIEEYNKKYPHKTINLPKENIIQNLKLLHSAQAERVSKMPVGIKKQQPMDNPFYNRNHFIGK